MLVRSNEDQAVAATLWLGCAQWRGMTQSCLDSKKSKLAKRTYEQARQKASPKTQAQHKASSLVLVRTTDDRHTPPETPPHAETSPLCPHGVRVDTVCKRDLYKCADKPHGVPTKPQDI